MGARDLGWFSYRRKISVVVVHLEHPAPREPVVVGRLGMCSECTLEGDREAAVPSNI